MNENQLTQKAYLNTITSWIDKFSELGVNFLVTPIIISLLGPMYFGIWKVLGQLNSYMAAGDARAGTSLKWLIVKERTVKSDIQLRKYVTSAMFSNLLFMPVYLFFGAVIVFFAPKMTGVEDTHFRFVRIVAVLLVSFFIVTQFFFIFESVLTGMNLAYKRMGLRALISVVGGGLSIAVLIAGYGLIGLASVQIIIGLITGLTFWWIVKNAVPWFGVEKVNFEDVIKFSKLTGKFLILKIADLLNNSVDMLLLGYLAGPKIVAVYAVSRFSTKGIETFIVSFISASTPGIGKFVGENNYNKVLQLRSQLISLNCFFFGIGGVLIILLNKSFITVWINNQLFIGSWETFLIVLITMLKVMCTIDASIVTMTLKTKKQTSLKFTSAITMIVFSLLLVPYFSVLGLLISLLIGTLIMNIGYLMQVSEFLDSKMSGYPYISRKMIVTVFLMIVSVVLSPFLFFPNWIKLIMIILPLTIAITALVWFLALNHNDRFIIKSLKTKIRFLNY